MLVYDGLFRGNDGNERDDDGYNDDNDDDGGDDDYDDARDDGDKDGHADDDDNDYGDRHDGDDYGNDVLMRVVIVTIMTSVLIIMTMIVTMAVTKDGDDCVMMTKMMANTMATIIRRTVAVGMAAMERFGQILI